MPVRNLEEYGYSGGRIITQYSGKVHCQCFSYASSLQELSTISRPFRANSGAPETTARRRFLIQDVAWRNDIGRKNEYYDGHERD